MARRKIVVANSVGRDSSGRWIIHFPSRWSFTHTDPIKYTYYPYELAYLSSILKRDTPHTVKFMDGNLRGWSAAEYVEAMAAERPDVLVMETATVVYPEDLKVARAMKARFGTTVIFAGQHVTAFPERALADGIDHVCSGEYELTVRDLMLGGDPRTLPGLFPNPRRPPLDVNDLPLPEDDDVRRIEYTDPPLECADYHDFEVFASRGCPFSCAFCVSGGDGPYYASPNWRPRRVDSIVHELRTLRSRYPQMQGVFFDEEMHNARKSFVLDLCQAIRDAHLDDLRYEAMCGYWTLDDEVLRAMKAAGYYKLRIGIETESKDVLDEVGKRIDLGRLEQVLHRARALGLRMYGTFMFGAPSATEESDRRTLALIRSWTETDLLYDLQLSIATPQPGTTFYRQALAEGWMTAADGATFDGARCAVVSYPHYPAERITAVYQEGRLLAEDLLIRRRLAAPGLPGRVWRSLQRRGPLATARLGAAFLGRRGRELLRRGLGRPAR